MRDFFTPKDRQKMTREEKEARIKSIGNMLNTGEYSGFLCNLEVIKADWQDHQQWGTWPYPGSRRDQPYAVLHDFRRLDLLREYFELRTELIKKSNAPEFKAG